MYYVTALNNRHGVIQVIIYKNGKFPIWNTRLYHFRWYPQVLPGGSAVKNLPAKQEMWVWSLGREDTLEKEMASHSNTLTWEMPWTEEPGRLQSKGSQNESKVLVTQSCPTLCDPVDCRQSLYHLSLRRVRHNWATEWVLTLSSSSSMLFPPVHIPSTVWPWQAALHSLKICDNLVPMLS